MAKTEKIEVRIPAETMAELQAIANSAGLKAEQVMALALAVDMRRWNRESGVRAERDAAIDMLRHLASAKRGADVRKMAALKVAELQGVNVQPNTHYPER